MRNEDIKKTNCIDCSVVNCVYHTTDDRCAAEIIHVGDGIACECDDTSCDTFEAKQ